MAKNWSVKSPKISQKTIVYLICHKAPDTLATSKVKLRIPGVRWVFCLTSCGTLRWNKEQSWWIFWDTSWENISVVKNLLRYPGEVMWGKVKIPRWCKVARPPSHLYPASAIRVQVGHAGIPHLWKILNCLIYIFLCPFRWTSPQFFQDPRLGFPWKKIRSVTPSSENSQ